MDWQQIAALTIVVVTAAAFVWARVRRHKVKLPCDTHCGCSGSVPKGESVVYHARKGERPEIIVKMR